MWYIRVSICSKLQRGVVPVKVADEDERLVNT